MMPDVVLSPLMLSLQDPCEETLPSDISDFGRSAASRSVSFESDITGHDSVISVIESPVVTPTTPPVAANSTSPHRQLRRTDALSPAATEVIHRKVGVLFQPMHPNCQNETSFGGVVVD